MPRTAHRPRWPWVLLGAYLVGIAVLVLSPLSFARIVDEIGTVIGSHGVFGDGWIEFIANVLVFVPLGFLFAVIAGRVWVGAVAGAVLSAAIETAQLVIPSRDASLRDLLANSAGAAIGAGLAAIVIRRRRARSTATMRAR